MTDTSMHQDEVTPDEMQKLYEESFKRVEEGGIVRGQVLAKESNGVIVDIGYKSEGTIPINEFTEEELKSVKPGDIIEVFIEEVEDMEGNIILSKEKADRRKVWEKIDYVYKEGRPITGKIVSKVKGGLNVDIGIKAFLPGSQIDVRPIKDLDKMVGQTCQVKIIKMDQKRSNVVVSRRALIEEQIKKMREQTLEAMEEGQLLEGYVKNITDYGVFIDLGGIDGLLHITDISWGRIGHPSEVFRVGDKISVKVLKYDPDTGRVSLGHKQKTPDPWITVEDRYPVNARVQGKVVSITDYGAFVLLEDGVEGLIHISDMSWTGEVKHPSRVVSVGEIIKAEVLSIDKQNRKISLGLKQMEPNPWEVAENKYTQGTVIEGRVRNITEFGAFVGLEEGIDGLIHISDMSWLKHVKHPSEVVKKGQKIQAIVLKVDKEKQRISLGIKQLTPDPWTKDIPEKYPVGNHVKGRIVKITDFGIFLELEEGVEGLIHVSESGVEPPVRAEDVMKADDEVWAKVIKIDSAEKKIALSIKEYNKDQERAEVEKYMEKQGNGGITLGEAARKIT
ncbi:MAG: 30S ribosomal protein S1 [Nitrospirae bacterium RIFCSPLOW2_12_42_9]|nr:MAG: 30S ribosomal protein S1 [Nitrospirae bacterium RIFCSPLOW2_12_42_9]HBI24240.1 30S ribosomal protein S1 [Nitrospiraceae bacterium]